MEVLLHFLSNDSKDILSLIFSFLFPVGCFCHCSNHAHYMYDSEDSLYSDESDDDYLFDQHFRARYGRRSGKFFFRTFTFLTSMVSVKLMSTTAPIKSLLLIGLTLHEFY